MKQSDGDSDAGDSVSMVPTGGNSADGDSDGGRFASSEIGRGASEDWQIGRMGRDLEIQNSMCIDIATALVKAMDTLK